jgi:hypothetical protein
MFSSVRSGFILTPFSAGEALLTLRIGGDGDAAETRLGYWDWGLTGPRKARAQIAKAHPNVAPSSSPRGFPWPG